MSRRCTRPRIPYGLRQGYLTERNTYATHPPQPHSPMGLFVVTDPEQPEIPPQMQFVILPKASKLELTGDGLHIHQDFTCVLEDVPAHDIQGHVFPLQDVEFRVQNGNPVLYLTPYRLPLIRLSDQLLEILDPALGNDYQPHVHEGKLYIGRQTPLGRLADAKEAQVSDGIQLECGRSSGAGSRFRLRNGQRVHLEECDCRGLRGGKQIGLYNTDLPEVLATVDMEESVRRRRRSLHPKKS